MTSTTGNASTRTFTFDLGDEVQDILSGVVGTVVEASALAVVMRPRAGGEDVQRLPEVIRHVKPLRGCYSCHACRELTAATRAPRAQKGR